MDIASVLMGCIFIIVGAATAILIKHIFGLSFWISRLLGVPLGFVFTLTCVFLIAIITKK